jgi:hypothetical protein
MFLRPREDCVSHPKLLHLQSPELQATTNTFHSNASRPHSNTLFSSNFGAHIDIELAPWTCGSKRDLWDAKETEHAGEREGSDVDGDKKTLLMRSTEKRRLLSAGEEPLSKLRIKRRRFSSPFLQMRKARRETNRTSAATHLPNPSTF